MATTRWREGATQYHREVIASAVDQVIALRLRAGAYHSTVDHRALFRRFALNLGKVLRG